MTRVMPMRALTGTVQTRALLGAVAATLLLGLLAPPASATTAPVEGDAIVSATTVRDAVPVATVAVTPLLTALGEPVRSRNLAVTTSLRGVYPSAYVGRYYLSRYETKRKCIVKRESHGYYTVGGSYLGAYQFGPVWRNGLVSMMSGELKKEVGSTLAASIGAKLKAKPINKWSRYWQDRAFWTVFNYKGPATGARNWYHPSYPC